jgi:Asp/Glu/hydantoin racemase
MNPQIACIHTSQVFLTKEPLILNLLREELPACPVVHLVDDALLSDLVKKTNSTASIQRRMNLLFEAAEAGGADVIFSLCSSLGPMVPEAAGRIRTPVVRIDEPMAAEAVARGNRITVLATVPTTLKPTGDLILGKANAAGKTIVLQSRLVDGAFDRLMCGLADEHDEAVYRAAEEAAPLSDCVVFAQASMARLAPEAEQRCGKPVLSSPRAAVERIRAMLHP